jgi:hypothetical protein
MTEPMKAEDVMKISEKHARHREPDHVTRNHDPRHSALLSATTSAHDALSLVTEASLPRAGAAGKARVARTPSDARVDATILKSAKSARRW